MVPHLLLPQKPLVQRNLTGDCKQTKQMEPLFEEGGGRTYSSLAEALEGFKASPLLEQFSGSINAMHFTKKNPMHKCIPIKSIQTAHKDVDQRVPTLSLTSTPSVVTAMNNLVGLFMDLFFIFRNKYMYIAN